jgi:hypothetical protein
MSDYDNLKDTGKLDETYGSLKATKETIEIVRDSGNVTQVQYDKLAEKFEEALRMIEVLKGKIIELESNKMPTKDDVESMSAMLDLLGKLDDNSISRLNRLGSMSKNE